MLQSRCRISLVKEMVVQGWRNSCRLVHDRHYCRECFRGLAADIRLNCIAGGGIFFGGDCLAQVVSAWKTNVEEPKNKKNDPLQSSTHTADHLAERPVTPAPTITHPAAPTAPKTQSVNIRRGVAMGLQGIVLNGIMLCPFYRWLDIAFGDMHKTKRLWPGTIYCMMKIFKAFKQTSIHYIDDALRCRYSS